MIWPNGKPSMVSERIEAREHEHVFGMEAVSENDFAAMNHGAWRTLHALRKAVEAGEITTIGEMVGLVYALELTYKALPR